MMEVAQHVTSCFLHSTDDVADGDLVDDMVDGVSSHVAGDASGDMTMMWSLIGVKIDAFAYLVEGERQRVGLLEFRV